MHVTYFEKSVAKKLISNFPPVSNCPSITVSKLTNYRHLTQYKQTLYYGSARRVYCMMWPQAKRPVSVNSSTEAQGED